MWKMSAVSLKNWLSDSRRSSLNPSTNPPPIVLLIGQNVQSNEQILMSKVCDI